MRDQVATTGSSGAPCEELLRNQGSGALRRGCHYMPLSWPWQEPLVSSADETGTSWTDEVMLWRQKWDSDIHIPKRAVMPDASTAASSHAARLNHGLPAPQDAEAS